MRRGRALCLWALALGCTAKQAPAPPPRPTPRVSAIAPRMVSNQEAYPVTLYGQDLEPGMSLLIPELGTSTRTVETRFVDSRHVTAILPAGLKLPPEASSRELGLRLMTSALVPAEGSARLTLVNDQDFRTPYALALEPGGARVFVASIQTDEVVALSGPGPSGAEQLPVGNRPRALATWRDPAGQPWLVVAEERGSLRLLPLAQGTGGRPPVRAIALGHDVQDVVVDQARHRAYVSSQVGDLLGVVDLIQGTESSTLPAGLNPRYLVLADAGRRLLAGNLHSEDVSLVELLTGRHQLLRPGPGTPIIGGHTAAHARDIMGGKAARGFAASDRLGVVFMSTIGPNIGPNKERMEVSMNGGVSVLDPLGGRYLRHVSILGGSAEGLALDERRGLLYVADGSTGRVVVMDAARLAQSDRAASRAILGAYLLPPPPEVPRIRPEAELGVSGRATASLHFGPKALALDPAGERLYVLSRFSGRVLELDVRGARQGVLRPGRVLGPWFADSQKERRKGEILYYTDLGNTRMSCDTCHPEGHVGGVLFSKGRPIRIYRAHTVRGLRESPPYFTPSRLPSIRRISKDVLSRNRFHNPDSSDEEMDALTEFTGTVVTPPSPYRPLSGRLPEELRLPDGRRGDAKKGLLLFEGKAGCAAATCHPPPSFTADQAQETRGLLQKLGTPVAVPLRLELQDLEVDYGQPAPSLAGVWDMFPLFLSGAGGQEVTPEGVVVARERFVLRWLLEAPELTRHSATSTLLPAERDDLLAYLLTL